MTARMVGALADPNLDILIILESIMEASNSGGVPREALANPASDTSLETRQSRPYQTPNLHDLGSLAKLQRYGFYYNDGKRYKDDY